MTDESEDGFSDEVEKAVFWQKYRRRLSERAWREPGSEAAIRRARALRAVADAKLAALLDRIDADPDTSDAARRRLGLPPRGMRELLGDAEE